jgi:hypothetical protein
MSPKRTPMAMPLCESCRHNLQASPSSRLCVECRLLAWPGVRALLTACVAERRYLERIRISFLKLPPSGRLYRGRRWGERG